ncbi:phosphotransferase family protein [Lentzea aerocolonigenes]|uniref:phosphotransferase family protein n=1 Tax=Lentzea aerocolonigenes TaxID=68170 RepID=UPI0004C2C5AA|nr:phosphotransferase family protein [Lentzea aerocolonigenes]MCP2242241.1 streptomycin 6-kinase [Lentzea aerocolonigenes]
MTLSERVRARLGTAGELEVLPGGHSGLTYTFNGTCVVKAVPPGQKPLGRNDVLRQARVLRALEGSPVPVPGVLAVDEEPPAWFAMEFADGEAIEPVLDEHTLTPGLTRARMIEAAKVLRRLHDSGPVTEEPVGVAGELERWSRTMHAVPAELRPGADKLLRLLGEDVPQDGPPVLVHGDFRLGNVLFAGTRPTAVVDWEIWSTGDRRVDLGWFLLFADPRNFPELGRPVPGLPSEDELLEAYGVELSSMAWFRALGRMKMAAIMGHNLRRHREGRHHDPDQERLPPTIAAMIRSAVDILTRR